MDQIDNLHIAAHEAQMARQAAADNHLSAVHRTLVADMLQAFEDGNGAQVMRTAGYHVGSGVRKQYTLAELLAEECDSSTCGSLVALIGACIKSRDMSVRAPAMAFAAVMAKSYADFHADDEAAK